MKNKLIILLFSLIVVLTIICFSWSVVNTKEFIFDNETKFLYLKLKKILKSELVYNKRLYIDTKKVLSKCDKDLSFENEYFLKEYESNIFDIKSKLDLSIDEYYRKVYLYNIHKEKLKKEISNNDFKNHLKEMIALYKKKYRKNKNLYGDPLSASVVIENFGWAVNRKNGNSYFNFGMVLLNKSEKMVRSTISGKIIKIVDNNKGVSLLGEKYTDFNYPIYGKSIIIIEDLGYYSILLSNLENIQIKEGDYISRGQEIGCVARNNNDMESYIFYAILYNRKPINPSVFLNFNCLKKYQF